MKRALLSVADKRGVVELARGLHARGVELISTGGTARALSQAEVPVRPVSAITGFPEMMDGRVKTLHPAIHAGILARRDRADDLSALASLGLSPIDIVIVNLYPFVRAAQRADLAFDELVEEIDIGGPTLVRAAAKNFRHVIVAVDPDDYASLIRALDAPGGVGLDLRFALARKAFAHTAEYDAAIADVLDLAAVSRDDGSRIVRQPWRGDAPSPSRLRLSLPKVRPLRYGENPHLAAAWYADGVGGLGAPSILQGKELSFTNLLDLDAAARIVLEFDEPAAAVIKHTNPCGVATGESIADAYVRAREADPLSAFGGIVGLNRPIDVAAATALTATFIEAVIAPKVDAEARAVLTEKANLRVLEADFSAWRAQGRTGRDLRSILGAVLVQERDRVSEAQRPWSEDAGIEGLRVVTRRAPTRDEWTALRFAWRICAHVKSNAVVFTGVDRTLAIGAGQTSRVDAVRVATMKAGDLTGSVAASDAFFPFRDGLDAVHAAGATAVVQPGGSVRDAEVIAAADAHDLAMVFTGRRHFRH